ncbi:MAG: hypothetical protein B6D44_09760 [Ignavibacteriales bacterium UTCHB2]|nr:MAG: hypothetical protein B6D44_09760 [Ignavibacteriales bacterium UTCHB2]HQI42301.1 hypothetical protein [Ignavibacteriaceae bacterium]
MKRAIITSQGTNLTFENLINDSINKTEQDISSFKTLLEIEKEHIINALKIADGKVTGENSTS